MKSIYTIVIYLSLCWGFTWQWTGRTHPELNWTTLETENFRVHYHQGIEDIAKEGASISEQVLPTLLQQMNLNDIPKIEIKNIASFLRPFVVWVGPIGRPAGLGAPISGQLAEGRPETAGRGRSPTLS